MLNFVVSHRRKTVVDRGAAVPARHGGGGGKYHAPAIVLSERSVAVWRFIARWRRTHDGIPPVVREIMQGCGISSTSNVVYHLRRLEAAGKLSRLPGRARAMQLCEPPPLELYRVREMAHDKEDWELLTDGPVPFEEAIAVVTAAAQRWAGPRYVFYGTPASWDFMVRTHSDNRFVAAVELVPVTTDEAAVGVQP